jgi:hypothetical protein
LSAVGKRVNGITQEHNGSMTGKQLKKRKAMGSYDRTLTVSSAFTRLPYNDTSLLGATFGQTGGQTIVKTKDSLKKNCLFPCANRLQVQRCSNRQDFVSLQLK